MRVEERLELARAAYLRAVALVRACPTSASWRRILAASRNLRDAAPARDRAEGGLPGRSPSGRPPPEGSLLPLAPRLGGDAPQPPCAAPVAAAPNAPARRTALADELERARALVAQSRRLVAEAEALRAAIDRAVASWQACVARVPKAE